MLNYFRGRWPDDEAGVGWDALWRPTKLDGALVRLCPPETLLRPNQPGEARHRVTPGRLALRVVHAPVLPGASAPRLDRLRRPR
jgi:hypothetical protein